MNACTFCGHSRLYGQIDDVKDKCLTIVEGLVVSGAADCFLVGNYGDFDSIAASVCLTLKRKYPQISVNLVIPYYRPHLDDFTKERYNKFDYVISPGLEEVPYKYRITKANEYMVNQADTVIAYVKYDGGAAKTLAYAKRHNKQIINLASEGDYCNGKII